MSSCTRKRSPVATPGHPGDLAAGDHDRHARAARARDLAVGEQVLQRLRAAEPERAHPVARPPRADLERGERRVERAVADAARGELAAAEPTRRARQRAALAAPGSPRSKRSGRTRRPRAGRRRGRARRCRRAASARLVGRARAPARAARRRAAAAQPRERGRERGERRRRARGRRARRAPRPRRAAARACAGRWPPRPGAASQRSARIAPAARSVGVGGVLAPRQPALARSTRPSPRA